MKVLIFVAPLPFLSELGSDQEDESVSEGGGQSYTKNQEVALSQVRFFTKEFLVIICQSLMKTSPIAQI